MIFLLDANVLITANRQYYPIDRVPEFWDWVQHMAKTGKIKIAQEIYEEIEDDEHGLGEWATGDDVKAVLLLDEIVDPAKVQQVIAKGYAADLTDVEIEKLGRDPFLIAYALVDIANRTVVTAEQSKPKQQRANRHVPDVCKTLAVPCCDIFELVRTLDFKTGWNKPG